MGLFNQFPYTNMHELNLDWILDRVKEIWNNQQEVNKTLESLQTQINELGENLDEKVDEWLSKLGPAKAQEWIAKWIATSVFFTISDSGYFIAHIPYSWDTINFATTGLDIQLPIQPEFGHLVLKY